MKQPIRRKVKKLRSQILSQWIAKNYNPGSIADIGGGKGLLSYILNLQGYNCTVIDPIYQELPLKFKDLKKNKFKIDSRTKIKRITSNFEIEMGKDFDLLVGLHAHGSNMNIINSAYKFKKDFILIPCCVIDEPVVKEYGINWRESLVEYAANLGLNPQVVKLNFVGKDIAIFTKNNK